MAAISTTGWRTAISPPRRRLGKERAIALYQAFDDSIDTIEAIIAEEGIDCNFRRAGKLKLASKPQHFDSIAPQFRGGASRGRSGHRAAVGRPISRREIGSPFHGAMLSKKSAMMHMGRYVVGLAEAAARHGAVIFENAPVTRAYAGRAVGMR